MADADTAEDSALDRVKRRAKRTARAARAKGFLDGICAMLTPGDTVIDCGANRGDVAVPLAATGARLIAFEPDPYAFALLSERLGDAPNAMLRQEAVGAEAGTVRLMRAESFGANPKGGSVKSTVVPGGRGIDEAGGVDVSQIDFPAFLRETVSEHGEIAFLKMDIEGAELDILEAMEREGLFAHIRLTLVETHERKFKALRPRFKALRARIAEDYPPSRVNLDWI